MMSDVAFSNAHIFRNLHAELGKFCQELAHAMKLSNAISQSYGSWSKRVFSLTMKLGKVTLLALREQLQVVLCKPEAELLPHAGGWHIFLYLGRIVLAQTKFQLQSLPKLMNSQKEETPYLDRIKIGLQIEAFVINSPDIFDNAENLYHMSFLMVKLLSEKKIDRNEFKKIASTCQVPPFWYSYETGLGAFRSVLEMFKAGAKTHVTQGPDMPLGQMAVAGITSMIQDDTSERWTSHRTADTDMVKSVWCIPEDPTMQKLLGLGLPSIKNSVRLFIPRPDDLGGPVPCQFICNSPLPFYVPTSAFPEGVLPEHVTTSAPAPVRVVINMHGGGFVAGSPQTHESYLRDWAIKTNCLVISIDYSLAPQPQFPSQINECAYIYQWIMDSNAWEITPSSVVITGDDSGGNLGLVTTLKVLMDKVVKKPDGLFLAYPVLDLSLDITSPSRLMYINDVVVPSVFTDLCFKAYVPEGVDIRNALISPLFATDDMLRQLPRHIVILSGGVDPYFDDATQFIRRLEDLQIPAVHKIYELLPHSFLNYASALIPECNRAKNEATALLDAMFQRIEADQMELTAI